jgi:hypothetical protein
MFNLIYHLVPSYPSLYFYFLPFSSYHSIMFHLHSGKFIMVKSDDVAAAMTRLFSSQVRT